MVAELIVTAVDAPLLEVNILPTGYEMEVYFPGQGVRTDATFLISGVLTDPTSAAVLVTWPDGTTTSPTPVKDSTGQWHADFVVPGTMVSGIGRYHWSSSGTPSQSGIGGPVLFTIGRL